MFDKYRARFAKFEEDHESVRKVTKHIEKHQVLYASGATGVICILGTRTFARPTTITNVIEQAAPVVAPVFNNTVSPVMNNVVENTINNAGHLHKIIKRIKPDGTEEFFETLSDGARSLAPEYGIKAASLQDRISKCINGHLPDYRGDQFVTVGVGAR